MFTKTFELVPSRRDAARLGVALWSTVFLAVVGISVPQGFVVSFGDWTTLLGFIAPAALLSTALYKTFRLVNGWPNWLAYTTLYAAMSAGAVLNCAADYGAQFAAHAVFDTKLPSLEVRDVLMVQFYYFCLFGLNLALFWIAAVNQRSRDELGRLAEAQIKAAQAETQAAKAELAALHYQLSPHFLLNSLNSVSGLIMDRRYEEADETVVRMAGFLRDVLKMEPAGRVTLDDELAHALSYLDIQRIRFPDRFSVQVDCPAELATALVPSLILQPLVENAVKYAVEPSDRLVRLAVRAMTRGGDLVLSVEDDGRGAAPSRGGTGIGLANVRSKLETYYGTAATCTAGTGDKGFSVELRMPLQQP